MNKILNFIKFTWIWLEFIIFILDFASKKYIMFNFYLGESVPVIPCVNLVYVCNTGAAFSFLANKGGWQRWFFIIITIIIIIVIRIIIHRSNTNTHFIHASYALIIGGALGNLFDRIVYGMVIDFIDFYIYNWHWPTFNIADVSIFIGSFFIVLNNLFYSVKKY